VVTYTREQIESKLRVLAVSGDPRTRELAASIRTQLDEMDADFAAPEERGSTGPVESPAGGSFRVSTPQEVADVRAILKAAREAYGTSKPRCPGRSK
jgi:hypothetical protein